MARSSKRRHTESTFRRNGGFASSNAMVKNVVDKIRAYGDEVLFAAKSALKDGVELIVQDAKSRCPVDTGKLKNSIKAVDVYEGAVYELSADAQNSKGIAYGQFVEFSPKINKPFMYPALDAHKDTVSENVKNAIKGARLSGNSAA